MREQFEVDMVERLFVSAKERGFSLVLAPLTDLRCETDAIADVLSQRIEGLFVLSADGTANHFDNLPDGLPAVTLMGPTAGVSDFRADDATGIRLLVKHLENLGHEKIMHVNGGSHPNSSQRQKAFEDAVAEFSLEAQVIQGAMTETGGAQAATALLEAELPTAIIAGNDRCARGIIGTLRNAGVRVPEDVSVAGYDNSSVARLPYLNMTTVDYKIEELTRTALDALISQADTGELTIKEPYLQPTSLVVRTSTSAPRN